MAIYALGAISPQIDGTAWVADSAQVVGNVVLGPDASVWFGAVIRGDTDSIRVGARSNVQDGSVLHTDEGIGLTLGEDVTIGHRVMLHGCTVGDGSLIGIGAIILNKAVIGRDCLVGAGAVVTEGKEYPDRSLIIGSPARVIRQLTDEQVAGIRRIAPHYVENAKRFRLDLRKIS